MFIAEAYTMAGSKKGEKAKEEEDVVMEEEGEWETDDEVEEQLASIFTS